MGVFKTEHADGNPDCALCRPSLGGGFLRSCCAPHGYRLSVSTTETRSHRGDTL